MSDVEREPRFKNFWGEDIIKPYVTFSKKGTHYCIYCGNISDTREHSPSKVFLSTPYPDNLPVLPACTKCNNGYSQGELYTELYIDSLRVLSGVKSSLRPENIQRLTRCNPFEDAKKDFEEFKTSGIMPTNFTVEKILKKLAICHMVYELSEGYNAKIHNITFDSLSYQFQFQLSQEDIKYYDCAILMNEKLFPELGSRVYEHLYICKYPLTSLDGNSSFALAYVFLDWTDIQDENYRYVAWFENDKKFHVKMIIHDFLYAEVIFNRGNN